jgi:predicted dehydrogenase
MEQGTTDMQFTKGADANMTYLQGEITSTYADLVRVFGEPDGGPDGDPTDKVTCEWTLKFEDGTIATIYDWKVGGPTPRGAYGWHIGGHNRAAMARVAETLRG